MSVLLAKEVRELRRTWRFVFLPVLFVLFGIAGPAFVRLLPVITKSAQSQMQITIPDMGPADAVAQSFSLARQLGLLGLILLSMGLVAGERRDGMLTVLFVKPVSRLGYLATRWSVQAGYLIVSFVLGSLVCALYTYLLVGPPGLGAVAAATLLHLSYFVLALSWTLFFSALLKSPALAGGVSLLPLFLLPVLGTLWSPLGEYGPYGAVAAGTAAIGSYLAPPAAVTAPAVISAVIDLGLSGLLVLAAYAVIRKAEL